MILLLALLNLLLLALLWSDRRIAAKQLIEMRLSTKIVNQKLHELTDNIAASIIIRDAKGKLIFCSPFTEVLTGYSLSEITASEQDFFEHVIHPDDRERYLRALQVSGAGEPFQFRCRFLHKTGIEMWAETRTVPLLPLHGEKDHSRSSLSITFDVTGTVRYQKLVEERNRDLHDFTYMVSHDLKAPLFTLKGMLEIIREECSSLTSSTTLTEPIGHMQQALNRLEALVAGVLEYSKISSQESSSTEIDLSTIFKEVLNDCAPKIQDLKANIQLPTTFPLVQGEQLKCYQIFSNLIQNALKYRDPARLPLIKIGCRPSNNRRTVIIEINDNGLGIPTTHIGSIFRPFHRAHGREIEGTGIGLACVKKIVDKLGGEVGVTSVAGVGSTFSITLNLAQPIEIR